MKVTRRKFLKSVATLIGVGIGTTATPMRLAATTEHAPKSPPAMAAKKPAAQPIRALAPKPAAKNTIIKPVARAAAVTPAKIHSPAQTGDIPPKKQATQTVDDNANAMAKTGLYAPILMYHHIGGKPGPYNVSITEFNMQMRWLNEHDYVTVSIDQIAAALRGKGTLPAKPVAITFDDGWRNQLNALPIMQDYGFTATFYLVANYITPKSNYFFDWGHVETVVNYGHQLGSHSGQHLAETRFSGDALTKDVTAARDVIKQHLGLTTTTHAYPYGITNTTVMKAVANAGYTAAVGVWGHVTQSLGQIYKLHRLDARGGITQSNFGNLIQGILTQHNDTPTSVPSLTEIAPEAPSARLGPDSR